VPAEQSGLGAGLASKITEGNGFLLILIDPERNEFTFRGRGVQSIN
jgi:hypothetical protein